QEIAQMLGLPASTPEEGVESFALAVERLITEVNVPLDFASQGIDKADYEANLEKIAMYAYEDQCSPANPRLPLVADMMEILRTAFDYKVETTK
ncbi:MAG: bifunctional acetaldehyde-CoA/alcohol dehydrogenase, partial [Culicoidibacterales bacterium]